MARNRINPPLAVYKKIAFTFITITIAIIAVVFYFAVSYAYITIHPTPDNISADFILTVVSDAQKAQPAQGMVAGTIVDQSVTASGTFPVSGTIALQQGATSRVRIVNNFSRSQQLVATTRLLTPEQVLYRIKNSVTVPVGGSVEADIYADNPTTAVRLLKGTKLTIPGLFEPIQEKIFAETVMDAVGEPKTVRAVTETDIAKSTDDLVQGELQKLLSDKLSQVRIISKEVLSQQWSAKPGDQTDTITGTVTVRVRGVMFDEAPVRSYAEGVLVGLLPPGKQLVSTGEQILYSIQKIDPDGSVAVIKGSVAGVGVMAEDNPLLDRSKFIRLNPAVLESYLRNIDGVESVDISFFPSWNKVMPRFEDHIIVTIVAPQD